MFRKFASLLLLFGAVAATAQIKISELPSASIPLSGSEVTLLVQGGATDKVTVSNLTAGRAVSAGSLTLGSPLPVLSGGTGVTTSTGSGANVLNTSPTLITPALGTPSGGVATNLTGLPLTTGVTGTLPVANGGTGVTTSTGTGSVVLSTSPTLVTPALGTPSALVGTNITGTAAGLTAGNVTTNANLTGPITSTGNATAVASQTGTGSTFVMNTSPTLVTPNLGTPSAAVLTNATGTAAGLTAGNVTTNANLTGPITSTGNATAVAAQTGTGSTFVMNTSPTLVTPNIGTPSAGVLTNTTGLPIATGLTGLGAANRIPYATSTTALATSSGLTFDGTNLVTTGSFGVGTSSLTGYNIRLIANLTGSVNVSSINIAPVIQSDVTSGATMYGVTPSTQAAAFTLSGLNFYNAPGVTVGSGSAVTSQFGFRVGSGFSAASNNYGFYSDLNANGSANWNFYFNGTAPSYINGSFGMGTTSLNGYGFRNSKSITGATTAYANSTEGVVQSDVTATAHGYITTIGTAAASFTLPTLRHFTADQGTFGVGSTVTSQYGFVAKSGLTGATNNYGFYSDIAASSGRWGFYENGTADNAFRGNVRIGGVTAPTVAVDVTGAVAATTTVKTGVYTVSGLPTCNAGAEGTRAYANDLTTPTFLGTATGGGAVHGPVSCNGTTWIVG